MKIIDRNGRIIEKKVGDYLYYKYKYIDSGGEWIKCTIEDIVEYMTSDGCYINYRMRINPEEYKKIIKSNEKGNLFGFLITKENAEKYIYTSKNSLFSIKT